MRNLFIIIAGNIAMECTVPLLVTVSALAGLYLAPSPWLATVPAAVQMLSASLLAVPFSRLLQRHGQKIGFMLAGASMCLGGVLAASALLLGNFFLLLFAHSIFGMSLVGINFLRYAAAESVSPPYSGTASSLLLASGSVAVVAGGFIYAFGISTNLAIPFIGVYFIISTFGAAATVIFIPLRVSPHKTNRKKHTDVRSGFQIILEDEGLLTGVAAIVVGQAIMLMVMTPASIAAVGCGLDDVTAGYMVSAHLFAMFAPGLITGFLMEKYGVANVISVGFLLNLGGFIAGLSMANLPGFYIAVPLIMSGIGWNFMFIGGTQVINAMSNQALRSRVKGAAETVLAGVSALFTLVSGVIFSVAGWGGVLTIAATLLLLSAAIFCLKQYKRSDYNVRKDKV